MDYFLNSANGKNFANGARVICERERTCNAEHAHLPAVDPFGDSKRSCYRRYDTGVAYYNINW